MERNPTLILVNPPVDGWPPASLVSPLRDLARGLACVADVEGAEAALKSSGGRVPAVVVIGPDLEGALVAARRLHHSNSSVHFVFATRREKEAELQRQIMYSVPAGMQWSIARADSDLAAVVHDALQTASQRRQFRTTLDKINVRLASRPLPDATDLRRLVASDHYLASILNHAHDAIISLDLRGGIVSWNRGAETLFGVSSRDAVGNAFGAVARWPSEFPTALARAVAGELVRAEFRLDLQGGSADVDVTLSPVRDTTSQIIAIACIIRDVTERRRAEEALEQSEARFRASFEQAAVGIAHVGLDGRWLRVNQKLCDIVGYPREELLGLTFQQITHPDDLPADLERLRQLLAGNIGTYSVVKRYVRKDWSTVWINLTVSMVGSPSEPDSAYFVSVVEDISGRKRADEARRMSEFRFQRLIEQSPLSTQIFAPDGTVRQVNRAWERLWGVTFADLAGYNILEDQQLVERGIMPHIRKAFAGEAVTVEPIPYVVDQGEHAGQPRWCGAFAYPVKDHAGHVEEVVLVHDDVTERKRAEEALAQSEAKFRQLANTIPQLAWMSHPDGWIFWYNDRWYEYTGTTPKEMEGWGWQSVHDPEVLPRVMERWKASIESGEPFEMTFPIKGADGIFKPFLTRVAPLRDQTGKPIHWFGTNTDISDQERLLAERQRLLSSEKAARERAELESRLKDEFLATLSHELRTPLNAILGWSELIARGSVDADAAREGFQVIVRNARVQAQLIEDLLDMSRIISGKVRLDVQRVNLADVVQAAFETVRPAAEAKGMRLVTVLDPVAGPISGDPGRLQQIVWNLLQNAVKFTPRGGNVEVLLERVNSHLELSVHDSGQGISADFLPHVFDRFRQADAVTTRRHGGLGLGLSIVKHLVELHGGRVRAESRGVGQGATFVVSFPLAPVRDSCDMDGQPRRHPTAPVRAAEAQDGVPTLKGVKALVVDDDADARELVGRVLGGCGAQVTVASSAREALDLFASARPDVLVSDIGMPEMDGYELIRQVRLRSAADGGATPAVALTAFARSDDRRRAVAAGFQAHLAKPVEPSELVTMVAGLAGRIAPKR